MEKQNDKIVDSGANKPGSPPKPVIVSSPTPLLLSAHSVLAVDVDSGVTLYEKNPDFNCSDRPVGRCRVLETGPDPWNGCFFKAECS